MVEQWYQLWTDIPIIGKQWGGWLRATPFVAQGLVETFQSSAASAVGVKWTLLDANGNAVKPLIPGLSFPGLSNFKL